MENKTLVVFRKFKDDNAVIALFPEVAWSPESCASYMQIGQHGGASWDIVIDTLPVTPEEYQPLLTELKSLGYDLEIKERITRKMLENHTADWKRLLEK